MPKKDTFNGEQVNNFLVMLIPHNDVDQMMLVTLVSVGDNFKMLDIIGDFFLTLMTFSL